nr:RNA-directed DNA polymerase, eukaryota [Tanacetum cinerariifolium]
MIFKVDFEKAFDSVRWDFLDDILEKFGFGMRWRDWIQSCLKSFRGSILVNGSPTSEFQFHKGLKQGDPISPLLFILVMENLHLSFLNVVSAGLFKGIYLNSSLQISHFFCADDVVFIGQWSNANISTIVHVLDCFFRASGLRINLHKSKLIGIAVDSVVVEAASKAIGCLAIKLPFSYLGISIGGYMSRLKAWEDVINKVVLKKLESIRSHFFNGANLNVRKMSFIKWDKVLASKDKGGLGVVISTLHGIDGNLGGNSCFPSNWAEINKVIPFLLLKGANGRLALFIRRWGKCVPIKVNILAWRIKHDLLPTRFNISRTGIDLDTLFYPYCNLAPETASHIFFCCSLVKDLFKHIARWWDIILMEVSSYEDWWDWFSNLRLQPKAKMFFEGVFYTTWWM